MTLPPFLRGRPTVHPEHAEHYLVNPPIRMGRHDMARTLIIVRADPVYRTRLRIAMWLVRLAGKIGGFKSVKLATEKTCA